MIRYGNCHKYGRSVILPLLMAIKSIVVEDTYRYMHLSCSLFLDIYTWITDMKRRKSQGLIYN